MYINYPAVFKGDPLVVGALLEPTNNVQQETYDAAMRAKRQYEEHKFAIYYANYFAAHLRHNFSYVGRRYFPFSMVSGPEVVKGRYNDWQGFEYLLICGEKHPHWILPQSQNNTPPNEREYREALVLVRRGKQIATHPSDLIGLEAAEANYEGQIDKLRMRQRRRRETV
jgi:hypothetical protein